MLDATGNLFDTASTRAPNRRIASADSRERRTVDGIGKQAESAKADIRAMATPVIYAGGIARSVVEKYHSARGYWADQMSRLDWTHYVMFAGFGLATVIFSLSGTAG